MKKVRKICTSLSRIWTFLWRITTTFFAFITNEDACKATRKAVKVKAEAAAAAAAAAARKSKVGSFAKWRVPG